MFDAFLHSTRFLFQDKKTIFGSKSGLEIISAAIHKSYFLWDPRALLLLHARQIPEGVGS